MMFTLIFGVLCLTDWFEGLSMVALCLDRRAQACRPGSKRQFCRQKWDGFTCLQFPDSMCQSTSFDAKTVTERSQ